MKKRRKQEAMEKIVILKKKRAEIEAEMQHQYLELYRAMGFTDDQISRLI